MDIHTQSPPTPKFVGSPPPDVPAQHQCGKEKPGGSKKVEKPVVATKTRVNIL